MAWTVDATSGKAIPQSSAEWTSFLASNATLAAWSVPDALYLLQEASGNPADSIGAFPLTASGTGIGYQSAVTGWSTLAISLTSGGTGTMKTTSASLPDISAASALNLTIAIVTSSVLAGLSAFGTPSANRNALEFSVTPRFTQESGANSTSGAVNPTGAVRPYVNQADFTNAVTRGITDQEIVTPAHGALAGKLFALGADARNCPAGQLLYSVNWFTSKAERSTNDIGALLYAMGFTGVTAWYTPPATSIGIGRPSRPLWQVMAPWTKPGQFARGRLHSGGTIDGPFVPPPPPSPLPSHYWGPHFPDAQRHASTKAAQPARLSLVEPLTNSGNFDLVSLVALIGGAASNAITVQFQSAFLPIGVNAAVSEGGTTCLVQFVGNVTTVGQVVSAINTLSSLIKVTGTFDALAIAASGDDEFGPTALAGGSDAMPSFVTFWGPHFPDASVAPAATIPGIGPAGAATFALALDGGFQTTFSWACDVIKPYSGIEFRSATLDDPKQTYAGPALLLSKNVLSLRTVLQQYAALGQAFLLGLPYESLTLTANSTGTTVHTTPTTGCDWANPGQRVVIVQIEDDGAVGYVNGVVQSVTTSAIVLDVAPGSIGAYGASIMPAVAIYLEASQQFDRWRPADPLERWTLAARAAFFGFFKAPKSAKLSLAPPVTNSGAATGVVLTAVAQGAAGNLVTVKFVHGAISSAGELSEIGTACVVKFASDGSTTMTMLVALLASSSLVTMGGTFTGPATLQLGDDEFGPTALAGGADLMPGTMGTGGAVKSYFGKPLWDRDVDNEDTITDTMQSMVEIVDLGALPFSVGMAKTPDYGRHVKLFRQIGQDWQWFKAFLFALRGAQVTWWLPTYRGDLVGIGNGPGGSASSGTILVDSTIGDFFTWWTTPRLHLAILQGGTTSYVQVTDAQDNHDGTLSLTIAVDPGDPLALLPLEEPMDVISWLELVRMEKDDVPVSFTDAAFFAEFDARVVPQ